ncbi:MAG: SDR family oxidoreductase [Pseudomonadota bacterium]
MTALRHLMTLDGRVAAITGGAGHIGRAMADALAELGAKVALVDVVPAVESAAEDLSAKHGTRSAGFIADLADEARVRALPTEIEAHLGGLDILIHNAGFVGTSGLKGWVCPFEEQSAETWRQAMEVNLTAPFVLTQAALPQLRRSGRGSVIMVSSIYGLVGPDLGLYEGTAMGNPAAYAASKGGMMQMTRWLATVLAPAVRVNAIVPGGVARNQPEPFVSRYVARTPLRRMATEDDFKGAAAYLASDMSAYVTGQALVVDGGWTAW